MVLNDKHYDLVLNFRQVMFGCNNNFCVRCCKYYSGKASIHVCFICYSIHSVAGETYKNAIKCLLCNMLFYEQECYDKHLYYFYCEKYKNVLLRYFWMKGCFHNHSCNKVLCTHCKKYAKSPHYCFMNVLDDMVAKRRIN